MELIGGGVFGRSRGVARRGGGIPEHGVNWWGSI